MAIMERALFDTSHAFDGVASTYDRSNTENPTLRAMRQRSTDAVFRHVRAGGHILDLGCGPGTDDEVFARAGYSVTAIDWSPAMALEARNRMRREGLDARVAVHHLGIQDIGRLPAGEFDAAFSNFGPLNCVPHLPHTARLIADRVRPGGVVIASVIGRVCPWEIALFAARMDWARIRVRFSRGFVPVPLGGRTVWTRYYSASEFTAAFERAGFEFVSMRALGLFMPPPYAHAFAGRHPWITSRLQQVEDAAGGLPILRSMGDHFLAVFRKA